MSKQRDTTTPQVDEVTAAKLALLELTDRQEQQIMEAEPVRRNPMLSVALAAAAGAVVGAFPTTRRWAFTASKLILAGYLKRKLGG